MPQTKIQGKFYPLTSDVTTKLRQAKLTAAEWRIWSYLVEIDPWGDRYQDIDSLDVMSKCNCSRATFYRAIAKFQKLGIFDLQDKGFSIRNLTGTSQIKSSQAAEGNIKLKQADLKNEKSVSKMRLDSQNCERDLKNEKSVSKMRLDSQNCERDLKNEKSVSKMRQISQICENQPPESPPDKASKSPQTLKTYSDFKRSLSEGEREKFFDFVRKKTENLERPINDLEAWLASKNAAKQNRWEIYYKNYQEEKISQSARSNKQNQGSGNYSPEQVQRAIAAFKNRRKDNQSVDEPENTNDHSDRQKLAKVNELLANPPKQEKSRAQQYREARAIEQQQQQQIRNARREAAERLAEQQNPDLEQRRLEMLRQAEQLMQSSQNTKPEDNR
ncbi:MAG: hypothetical protein QNJ72_44270 [Pleurocapsa sp. MO_226.B13]|nr:hypothetical protein [Pleurocapsa sp. MO_226.B13]